MQTAQLTTHPILNTEKRTANLRLYPHKSAAHNVSPILEMPGKTASP